MKSKRQRPYSLLSMILPLSSRGTRGVSQTAEVLIHFLSSFVSVTIFGHWRRSVSGGVATQLEPRPKPIPSTLYLCSIKYPSARAEVPRHSSNSRSIPRLGSQFQFLVYTSSQGYLLNRLNLRLIAKCSSASYLSSLRWLRWPLLDISCILQGAWAPCPPLPYLSHVQ